MDDRIDEVREQLRKREKKQLKAFQVVRIEGRRREGDGGGERVTFPSSRFLVQPHLVEPKHVTEPCGEGRRGEGEEGKGEEGGEKAERRWDRVTED